MPCVLLCAESRIYREGLAHILRSRDGFTPVESRPCLEALARILDRDDPDVIVLDTSLCDAETDCTEAVRTVLRLANGRPIVALGLNDDDEQMLAALEAGAAGCVTREQSVDDLISVITSAVAGELCCPPRVVRQMQQRLTQLAEITSQVGNLKKLSQQEHFILRLLEQRMSNKQIARQLGLELSTIKNHVHNILVKLDVANRTEAAALMSISSEASLADTGISAVR